MTELEKKLQAASQAYYTNGSSDLSDDEFDKLVEQVRTEQPDSELLKKIGWGYEVDKDTTPGEKCKHKYGKAGSLTKAYSWTELGDGFKNHKVDISAKLDGLSVVLYYEQGELVQALTRGDGITGIDITDKARYIIGTHIPDNEFTGAVRGEILMSHENFKKYKNTHPDAKNARNTSAGLINGKTITTDFMFLDIIPYSIVGMEWDTLMRLTANHSEVTMDVVRNWLHINFKKSISYTSMILNNTDELSGLFECWSEEYPIDGLVISEYYIRFIDAVPNQIAQAYKFKSEAAQVKVVNVEWNMSKNRLAIPRVQVEPVELVGTTVQYCTGYNAKYILDNNIGVGAIVEVEKHGEIIPNINKVVAISNKAELPAFCPYCNCELQWHGVHLECTNPNCENTTIKDTMIWTNIIAPIDNLGELLKEKFFVEWFGSVPTIEVLMRDKLPTYAFAYAVKGSQAHRMRCMLDSL